MFMLPVSKSISVKSSFAPQWEAEFAVEQKVFEVAMFSFLSVNNCC